MGVGAHCASRLCRVAMAPRHQRGPQLPFRLEREIEDRAAASSAPERLGRTHIQRRKFARKAARRDKKRIRGGWLPQTVPPVEQNSKREASKKRIGTTAKPKAALKQSSKKNKGRVAKLNATVKRKSKFLELTTSTKKKLLDDIEAENQYQKKLAKKLGADAKKLQSTPLLENSDDELQDDDPTEQSVSEDDWHMSLENEQEEEDEELETLSSDGNMRSGQQYCSPSTSSLENNRSTFDSKSKLGTCAVSQGRSQYVPPALRQEEGGATAAVVRRLRGLLNKLVESNIQSVVREVGILHQEAGRSLVAETVVAEILQAVKKGPRASKQFASVAAAFVTGLTATANAQEIAAQFLAAIASALEESYEMRDSLACTNLVSILCNCYLCGMMDGGLLYSLLDTLTGRFDERDVSLMYTILKVCGWRLRSDDPKAMKDYVLGVHARAAQVSQEGQLTKRAELMLDMVVDIKNNRRKGSGQGTAGVSPEVMRWLTQSGVEGIHLGTLSWDKLLDPDKKGLWWASQLEHVHVRLPAVASLKTGSSASGEGMELVQLAASQRMNTDVRRAVFCIVMGSQDYIEAYDSLTRLVLKGEREREIIRVLVDCCLQERWWNLYYAHLALRLCLNSGSHRKTLQFLVKDKLLALADMPSRHLHHLACLLAALIVGRGIPLSIVKEGIVKRALQETAAPYGAAQELISQIAQIHIVIP